MSADSCVAYYGVRCRLASEEEREQCEARTHPWMLAARKAGLQHYWGNFPGKEEENYWLFIGKQLGVFGVEGMDALELPETEFQRMAQDTRQRFVNAGIAETPALLIQYAPDL